MKRIKTVNGYAIYQAATQKDADNYNCEIGNYNIYIAQDIRDYGLTNSYPEWENEDSLAVVLARCNGSNYAVACALADELSDSTVQDMDLVLEIERRLDAGEALETIRESYDTEEQCFIDHVPDARKYGCVDLVSGEEWYTMAETPAQAASNVWAGTNAGTVLSVYDAEGAVEMYLGDYVYGEGFDDELQDGDLEDVLDQAMTEPTDDRPSDDQPNQYLAVITWEDNGKTETSYSIKSAGEIFSRIDMYDCYDEDLSLWLLTPEGPQPCDWHGTWHDPNDPLKMSITLRSTGNVLDPGWGTDH